MDDEIIITYEDTLQMLDEILEKRDHEWWNRFYSDREKPVPFFKDIPDEELVSYCEDGILTGGNALDIGCGNGRNSRYLAAQGFQVTGIDISWQSLGWARDLTDENKDRIHFQCASMLEYAADAGSFDFILDSGCFHHIKPHRREQYIKRILHCLKDDGYFLLTCFNLDGGANISDYDVYRDFSMYGGLGFSEYKIKSILNHYFDIMEFRKMRETDNVKTFGKDFMWVILMKKKSPGKPESCRFPEDKKAH